MQRCSKKIINTYCLKCNKRELSEEIANTYTFCDGYINKFCLMLRKEVYPCKYTDNWERFNETSLSDKNEFYSSLNIEDITV